MAEPSGTVATVTTSLSGHDSHTLDFTVYGTPAWFSARRTSAGIAVYATSDPAGAIPAETMRAGETFYLQLYAHTGGEGMTAFEAELVEDSSVCAPVPESGAFDAAYTGPLRGDLSGTYQTEVLQRIQNPSDATKYFIKYSRLQKLTPLQATHGHLGYLEMRLLGSGTCLTSAAVGTAFYFDGGTAFIAGVSAGAPIDVYGNAPQVQLDAPVGVLAQMEDAAPVVNTGYLIGNRRERECAALRYLAERIQRP